MFFTPKHFVFYINFLHHFFQFLIDPVGYPTSYQQVDFLIQYIASTRKDQGQGSSQVAKRRRRRTAAGARVLFLQIGKHSKTITKTGTHQFDLFCTSTSLLRPVYFDPLTSTYVLRPLVKSGFIIGRETQVEVQFWSK